MKYLIRMQQKGLDKTASVASKSPPKSNQIKS